MQWAIFVLVCYYCLVGIPLYHILLLGEAIIIASLSYTFYESYFLRLKDRYA